ncbi:hypothetical protein [Pseudoxanthomonas sp. JBR18]|uniref:hypothetical protein n=1 Tax=Pseudoxanthomonas sp. JBR18 TaxID=2969308 RepID=UPI002304D7F7|nr:hypothetical protein [Pseudoxanthomonas sp. JBR18]WCE05765.1 hypothetical protein PJ250_07415 [Pseudoxanthomonas sp. JBR18]
MLSLPATVVFNRHAGTWLVHGLWLVLMIGAALVPLDPDKAHILRLVLAGGGIGLWWLLMSGHLLGAAWQMHRMRLPKVWSTLARLLLPSWVVTAVLPALLFTWLDQAPVLSNVWILSVVALGTILVTSLPPVVMVLLPAVALVPRVLEIAGISFAISFGASSNTVWLPCLLLASITACWWPLFRHGAPTTQWRRPIAIALQTNTGAFSLEQMRQQQTQRWFGGNVPPALTLPDTGRARAALGVSLGPGLGTPTLTALLQGHLWLLILPAMWWLSSHGDDSRADRVSLFFPAFIVASVAVHALMRLWTLFRKPELGLHDLALLPGLPAASERGRALVSLLLTRMVASTSITTAIMAGYGMLSNAPLAYYSVLLGTGLASVLVNACVALWCVARGGMHGMVLGLLMCVEAIALLVANASIMGSRVPTSATLVGWTMMLVAAGVALGRLRRRIDHRSQPWIARRPTLADGDTWQAPTLIGSGGLLLATVMLVGVQQHGDATLYAGFDARQLLMSALGVTGVVLIGLGLRLLRRAV